MKYVIVPQSDIDKLEEARLKLWQIASETQVIGGSLLGITGVMWKLSHKKYPKARRQLELDFGE